MKTLLKDLLIPIAKPLLSKVHRYRNIHKGESCYLIGDGVSLKWFNLKAFDDKIAIPCGLLPWHKDFVRLNIPYIILIEPFWFYPTHWTTSPPKKVVRNHIQKAYKREIIDRYVNTDFFINLSNFPTLRRGNVNYLFRDFYDERLPVNFITKRIDAFAGSLRTSIAMAIYMGFDHIYLVGYDYTHNPSRNLHWYEKGQGFFYPIENYNKDFFKIAREFVDITTITLDGTSDFINSITYKNHTGFNPVYRENNEIMDGKYLKLLATWTGYDIF